MSRSTMGTGSLTSVVDDRTRELVRAAVERVAPGALDIIERETRKIYDNAHAKWPIGPHKAYRPGHSRDMLYWEVLIDGAVIRGRVWCTAEWSKYIKPKGLRGKSAFVELLRKPLRAARAPLTAELGRFVVAELGD